MQLFNHYYIDDEIVDLVWQRHLNEIAKLKQKAKEATDCEEARNYEMEAVKMSIWSKMDCIMAVMQVLLSFWTKKRLVFVDRGVGEFEKDGSSLFKEQMMRLASFIEAIDDAAKFKAAKSLAQCGTDEEADSVLEQIELDCEI